MDTTASTPPTAGTPWSELVTAALLGAERRTPPGGSVTALLDAAAVETVRRRAGMRPAVAGPRPEPSPADERPPLPAAAEHRLSLLLARGGASSGGGGGRRGTAPDLGELLPQWLAAANAHGYRAPEAKLPALLDAARARTDLRPQTLAFAGPRGRWLARLNPDWKFALRNGGEHTGHTGSAGPGDTGTSTGTSTGAEAVTTEVVQALWDEGLFAERVTLLASLRRRDPAAGLALLASSWSAERAEDRLMFLDSLRDGLSPADEPFLEQALADRSRTVRATGAELLSALPGSALAGRMARRASSCVSLDPVPDGPDDRILVEAPHECDAEMQRDGVVPKPPAGRGERAWWLGQLVETAPLATWTERFGGRTPAEIIALPVADDWQQDLHAAWCLAAVRQRDVGWARALVGAPGASPAQGPGDPAKLLAVLPPEERAVWAARFIAAHGLSEAFRILGVCAVPWSDPLGRAVMDALEIARDAGSYPWSFSGVMGLAERCLDPVDADRLAPLAAVPDEPEDGSPGAGSYWSEAFQRLVSTLRLRAEMRAELRGEALGVAAQAVAAEG
ncbi:DUF5691 domain-containing protein [Streptomyces sp. N2-109]|uniref:DUF5691 domain-containing protein n=1 Tax=Streptomyces gossypii TaxID=2883101 RepID=A0ABT2JY16_9ACTN|nr:DUF5691 domain-containing protein [Streptomyces gossypii]MCT2592339.1 DUF5691 domain-containing protein [Streptomyces gossypii]